MPFKDPIPSSSDTEYRTVLLYAGRIPPNEKIKKPGPELLKEKENSMIQFV